MERLVTQSCLTLCYRMDCSLPGSSVHGILQARILEWFAIPFSRGSSQLRDQTQVSCIWGRFFIIWTTSEVHWEMSLVNNYHHTYKNFFIFLWWELLRSTLIKFKLCSTVLLTIVPCCALYSHDLCILWVEFYTFWASTHFTYPTSGNRPSILCIYFFFVSVHIWWLSW